MAVVVCPYRLVSHPPVMVGRIPSGSHRPGKAARSAVRYSAHRMKGVGCAHRMKGTGSILLRTAWCEAGGLLSTFVPMKAKNGPPTKKTTLTHRGERPLYLSYGASCPLQRAYRLARMGFSSQCNSVRSCAGCRSTW